MASINATTRGLSLIGLLHQRCVYKLERRRRAGDPPPPKNHSAHLLGNAPFIRLPTCPASFDTSFDKGIQVGFAALAQPSYLNHRQVVTLATLPDGQCLHRNSKVS